MISTGYTPDVINLDISDIAHPKLIGRLTMTPPFMYAGTQSLHSVLPLWDRKLLYASSEAMAPGCDKDGLNWAGFIDNKDPAKPRLLSLFPTPRPAPGLPYTDFCYKGGRFGPHNTNQEIHNPDVEKPGNIMYVAWFNAGLRVFDISDPHLPTETGWFLPPERPDAPQTAGAHASPINWSEEVAVDTRGNIFMDEDKWGIFVLRYKGPGQPAPTASRARESEVANLQLTFAAQDYEHTRALTTGKVKAEGIDLTHVELFPAFTFQRMLGKREFECSEMAMTLYFSTLDRPDPPFIAIPVFPVRTFRHSAFFVRAGGSVREPRDLIGKTVGEFFFYGHDAGLWAKGALEDEYGVRHDSYSYKIGGVGRPFGPQPWLPSQGHRHASSSTHIGAERTLDQLLEAGEIDALVAPVAPPSMLKGEAKVRRLFENYEEVERAYFAATGIFPIMHTLVIRRDIYRRESVGRGVALPGLQGGEAPRLRALPRGRWRSTTPPS